MRDLKGADTARDKRTLLPGTNEAATGYLKGADTIIGVEGLQEYRRLWYAIIDDAGMH